ncbi:hypothetical protein HX37_20555 [Salmonella enterica]|uniref:Dienelactone hydrolase domain-containing protein n=1 Tax=Salmonella enterica TaxID=28901 RepID=A0A5U2F3J8_SALER|nr:hypothetical protein [Salmonella enterica]HAK1935991.1 hypothetical protein [Salmonella enterica]
MFEFISGNDNAIVVLHEIYGVNDHIKRSCKLFHKSGFDVYCPDFLNREPFTYGEHEEAYNYFNKHCGFNISRIMQLTADLRPSYKKIIIVGFSVGGTLAWLSASKKICDGIVSFYGSRIRDYTEHEPDCPVLVIQAKYEEAYDPVILQEKLSEYSMVSFRLFDGKHGFCDVFSPAFNQIESVKALVLSHEFISNIIAH